MDNKVYSKRQTSGVIAIIGLTAFTCRGDKTKLQRQQNVTSVTNYTFITLCSSQLRFVIFNPTALNRKRGKSIAQICSVRTGESKHEVLLTAKGHPRTHGRSAEAFSRIQNPIN